eukprot:m.286775 g.286775  ORF g.286775 m.286775 type:complete len:52 (-) comp186781_c0_seq1:7-162(-)
MMTHVIYQQITKIADCKIRFSLETVGFFGDVKSRATVQELKRQRNTTNLQH